MATVKATSESADDAARSQAWIAAYPWQRERELCGQITEHNQGTLGDLLIVTARDAFDAGWNAAMKYRNEHDKG